ncbi:cytochrome P450 2H2-like [Dermacentor silvarum]|uniref:cytochrome P450 2H2-like n=1 Tax=Dermacentor silvarum TaxID=543639 RepID=UPI00189766AE|nr:cytochrome P450 2H2-like [Dermacentor silvarum]
MDSTMTVVPLFQVTSVNWLYLSLSIAFSFLLFAVITSNMNKPRIPKGKKLPPGPRGFPLVGHLPYGPRNFDYRRCLEISKQHGPVFRLKIGVKDIVILNDFDSIKDVLTRKDVLNRTDNFILDRSGVKGIVTLNGDAWQDNRRFCLHVLRDLGFGRKSMEEHIKDEVQYLADKILELRGSPVDIRKYLIPSMSNNITSLVFGRRYPFEDHRRKFLDERLRKVVKIIGSGSLFTFLPSWAFLIFTTLPFTNVAKIKEVLEEMFEYVSEEVKQHESSLDESSNRDFIDGYIKKMKENKDNPRSSFKMGNLLGNVLNFFGAGSNTVQISIQWHLLNCADKVESVQRNIQNEIDSVVGHERQPCWEDHNNMHFTMATIWEMYRWRTVAPLSIPREAAEDVEYKDYFIPKGTVILPNLSAVHLDPVTWESPEIFDPHRFLKKDGSGLIAKPDQLIPFSIGRRMCPGETLATVEIFLYLTTLLQKFTVMPLDGKRVDLEPAAVALNMPAPQQLKFLCRE